MTPLAAALSAAVSEAAVAAWLVRTSWQTVVLVAIVAGVQLVFGKLLTPRWRYAMWMLVALRLLMPVAPRSEWSVFNVPLPRADEVRTVSEIAKPQAADGVTVTVVKTFDVDADLDASVPAKVAVAPTPFDWRRALLAVWAAGAVLLLLRLVVAHVLLTRRLRGASAARHDVLELLETCKREMRVRSDVRVIPTDAVGGPALFGFVRPALLVPPAMLSDLSREDLRFVFLHELAHLRRRDTLLNLPLALAAAVHWFNPAAWFALSRCRTERELACDAMVLDVTGGAPDARHGYGQTMLRLAEALCAPGRRRGTHTVPAALGILQTRSQLNRRIAMISAFRRSSSPSSSRWSVLPAVLLVGVASCALTDKPAESSSSPATQPVAADGLDAVPSDAEVSVDSDVSKTAAQALLESVAAKPDETPGIDAETARMNQLLDRRFGELNFDAIAIDEAIEFLRQKANANILVNWRVLEAAGIDRKAPVSARLRDVKFAKALRTILDDVGGGTVQLGYTVDEGVITITTAEDLARNTVTRVYDVRDLITEVTDYVPPGGAKDEPKPQPTTQPRSQPTLADQVRDLIQETVQPEAWRDNGGSVGSIRELSGQFIITATAQMHEEIGKLLHLIREGRGVQVAVETRFITIDPTLLDKALGERLKGTLGKSGAATVWQLSDDEVQAVLRATQASQQSTLVTAPRITLFNGQRAYVKAAKQTAYVAGFTVVKTEGGETRYEPKIGIVDSGVMLDVRATASADRQQAVLTLKPKLSRLDGLGVAPYPGLKDLHVQVPFIVEHTLETTLSIPDRGTALIGGFTQNIDTATAEPSELIGRPAPVQTEVEVPNGGRLLLGGSKFATTTLTPPSQNVFVLVKPTLIITAPQAHKRLTIRSVPAR